MYTGLIIKEGLSDIKILEDKDINISKIENWDVGEQAADFQPKNWTAVFIEGDEKKIELVAQKISETIMPRYYANLSNDITEFVIFYRKIFKHSKTSKKEAQEVINYGLSQGIPKHQLDWIN